MEFALRHDGSTSSSLYLDETCVWKHATSSSVSTRDAMLHLVSVATSSATSLDGTPAFDATRGFGTCVASSIVALLNQGFHVQLHPDVVVTHPGIHAQTSSTSLVLHVARQWDLYPCLFVRGGREEEQGTAADVTVAHEADDGSSNGFALCLASDNALLPTMDVASPTLPWVWVVRSQHVAIRIADTITTSDECLRITAFRCGIRVEEEEGEVPTSLSSSVVCPGELQGRRIHVDVVWDQRPLAQDAHSFPAFALSDVQTFASTFMDPRHALVWSRSPLVCALFQAVQDPLWDHWRMTRHDPALQPTTPTTIPALLLSMLRDSRVHEALLRHVDATAVMTTTVLSSSSQRMDAMADDVFRRFASDAHCDALTSALLGVRTAPFPCQRLAKLIDLGCFSRCRHQCPPHGLLMLDDGKDTEEAGVASGNRIVSSSSSRRGWWLVVGMNATCATLFAALGSLAAQPAPTLPCSASASPLPEDEKEANAKQVCVDSEIVLTWGTAWYERDPVVAEYDSLCREAPYRLRLDVNRGGVVLHRVESERTTSPTTVWPIDALSRTIAPTSHSPLRLSIDESRRRRNDLMRSFPQLTRRLRMAQGGDGGGGGGSSRGGEAGREEGNDDAEMSAILRELQARRTLRTPSTKSTVQTSQCWTLDDMDTGRNLGSLGLSVLLGLLLSGWLGARVRLFVTPRGGAVVGAFFVSTDAQNKEEEELRVFDPTHTSCNAFDLLPRMSDLPQSGYEFELKRGIFVEVMMLKFWHVAYVTGVHATAGMIHLDIVETGKTIMVPIRSLLWRRLARGENTHVDRAMRSLLAFRPHNHGIQDSKKRSRVQESV